VQVKKGCPYVVFVRLHVEGMCSRGWPKKAKGRYKKLDITNRLKVLEDIISDVTDVDDSHNLVVVAQKVDAPEDSTEVWVWNMEEEETPFNAALYAV
jgi:hypothetical protein